jgi:hypothetical protein
LFHLAPIWNDADFSLAMQDSTLQLPPVKVATAGGFIDEKGFMSRRNWQDPHYRGHSLPNCCKFS